MHRLRLVTIFTTGMAALLLIPAVIAQTPTLATGDTRNVTVPHYPAVCQVLTAQFSSSQRSSPPANDDTSRVQDALNSCENTGKSVVLAATPTSDAFYTGKIQLHTDETLVIGWGATLFGNDSYASEGELISGGGSNMGIMGPGTIDGRGDRPTVLARTPRLINVKHLTNFTVYNVTLTHAAKMHLYIEEAKGATVWNLRVMTPANTKNTDGVDIDSSSDVTVAHSFIEDGDDGIVVKTNSAAAANITVKNNLLLGTHGLSIGSQTMYGVSNVLWENNIVYGSDLYGNVSSDNNGIRIKSSDTCGGPVTQVTYRNTLLIGVKHLMDFETDYSCSGKPGIPQYTDIVVDGFASVNSQSGAYSKFQGYSTSNPLQLYLAYVYLDATAQSSGNQYAAVGLDRSNIVPTGPGVTTFPFTMPPPFF